MRLILQVYDVVTARAVAEMRVLAELCLPMVRVDGFLVAYKVRILRYLPILKN